MLDCNQITVAVDAMGGDNAPEEIVKGAVDAVNDFNVNIILVGIKEKIEAELDKYDYNPSNIEILHASEIIGMDEAPATAIRRKKDSSIVVGLNAVKSGKASAFVSAGSTGALLTGATVIIGRISGIERPALGTFLPNKKGFSLLLDSGANVDCKPKYLEQFAKIGAIYAENILKIENPTVSLVNIGSEKEKGNQLTKESYSLLEESGVNFIGNIEPKEIPYGKSDVIICDGFTGNVILKLTEGLGTALFDIIKEEITKGFYKFLAAGLKKPFKQVKNKFDADEVGGAPFLGLNSLVIKAHGSAKAKAIKNAVSQCIVFSENNIVAKIEEKL